MRKRDLGDQQTLKKKETIKIWDHAAAKFLKITSAPNTFKGLIFIPWLSYIWDERR